MSKGKVSTKEDDFIFSNSRSNRPSFINKYQDIKCSLDKELKYISISFYIDELEFDKFLKIEIGEEIIFKGNRIILKLKSSFKKFGKEYVYMLSKKSW